MRDGIKKEREKMVQCGQRIEQLEHDIIVARSQTGAREAQLAHELKIRLCIAVMCLFPRRVVLADTQIVVSLFCFPSDSVIISIYL